MDNRLFEYLWENLMVYLLAEYVGILEQKFWITRELVDGFYSQVLSLSKAGMLVKKNDQIDK